MSEIRAAAFLFLSALCMSACDRSPPAPSPAPSPAPAPAASPGGPIKASDPACALPLRDFARRHSDLVGNVLEPRTNLVAIDSAGQVRWNGTVVEPRILGEYLESQARIEPPIFPKIVPDRDAPCAVVRETMALAIQAGRCSPERCSFEWPGANAPPLLPERSKLLGDWILASIDGAPPPRQAPRIELTFTEGAIVARSQCVTYNWLIGERDGRLRLRTPPGPVAMCARATSPWEDRFDAAMAAASYIESDGDEIIVTGPKGKLRLKRPN